MNKYGVIRTIVIQREKDKKRSAIYTNAKKEEIGAEKITELICRRWGEENLIKELLIKHLINYSPFTYYLDFVRRDLPQLNMVVPRLNKLDSTG